MFKQLTNCIRRRVGSCLSLAFVFAFLGVLNAYAAWTYSGSTTSGTISQDAWVLQVSRSGDNLTITGANNPSSAQPLDLSTGVTGGSLRIAGIGDGFNGVFGTLGKSAGIGNKVSSVTFPATGFTTIGNYAFYGCTLLTGPVVIPANVTTIGDSVFRNSKITSMEVKAPLTVIPSDFCGNTPITSVTFQFPGIIEEIGYNAFSSCTSLTSFPMASLTSLKTIGAQAFNGYVFSTLPLPATVETIDSAAFMNAKLASITFGPNVKTIGSSAFTQNHSLVNVVIPDSVTSFGSMAFQSCAKLATVSLPAGANVTYDKSVFAYCTALTSVTFRGVHPTPEVAGIYHDYGTGVLSSTPATTYVTFASLQNWNDFTPEVSNGPIEYGSALWKGRPIKCADLPKTTITLDRNGGSGGTASVTATYCSHMPTADAPTRSAYRFDGYYDGATQYYAANMASSRLWDKTDPTATLVAKWTLNAGQVPVGGTVELIGVNPGDRNIGKYEPSDASMDLTDIPVTVVVEGHTLTGKLDAEGNIILDAPGVPVLVAGDYPADFTIGVNDHPTGVLHVFEQPEVTLNNPITSLDKDIGVITPGDDPNTPVVDGADVKVGIDTDGDGDIDEYINGHFELKEDGDLHIVLDDPLPNGNITIVDVTVDPEGTEPKTIAVNEDVTVIPLPLVIDETARTITHPGLDGDIGTAADNLVISYPEGTDPSDLYDQFGNVKVPEGGSVKNSSDEPLDDEVEIPVGTVITPGAAIVVPGATAPSIDGDGVVTIPEGGKVYVYEPPLKEIVIPEGHTGKITPEEPKKIIIDDNEDSYIDIPSGVWHKPDGGLWVPDLSTDDPTDFFVIDPNGAEPATFPSKHADKDEDYVDVHPGNSIGHDPVADGYPFVIPVLPGYPEDEYDYVLDPKVPEILVIDKDGNVVAIIDVPTGVIVIDDEDRFEIIVPDTSTEDPDDTFIITPGEGTEKPNFPSEHGEGLVDVHPDNEIAHDTDDSGDYPFIVPTVPGYPNDEYDYVFDPSVPEIRVIDEDGNVVAIIDVPTGVIIVDPVIPVNPGGPYTGKITLPGQDGVTSTADDIIIGNGTYDPATGIAIVNDGSSVTGGADDIRDAEGNLFPIKDGGTFTRDGLYFDMPDGEALTYNPEDGTYTIPGDTDVYVYLPPMELVAHIDAPEGGKYDPKIPAVIQEPDGPTYPVPPGLAITFVDTIMLPADAPVIIGTLKTPDGKPAKEGTKVNLLIDGESFTGTVDTTGNIILDGDINTVKNGINIPISAWTDSGVEASGFIDLLKDGFNLSRTLMTDTPDQVVGKIVADGVIVPKASFTIVLDGEPFTGHYNADGMVYFNQAIDVAYLGMKEIDLFLGTPYKNQNGQIEIIRKTLEDGDSSLAITFVESIKLPAADPVIGYCKAPDGTPAKAGTVVTILLDGGDYIGVVNEVGEIKLSGQIPDTMCGINVPISASTAAGIEASGFIDILADGVNLSRTIIIDTPNQIVGKIVSDVAIQTDVVDLYIGGKKFTGNIIDADGNIILVNAVDYTLLGERTFTFMGTYWYYRADKRALVIARPFDENDEACRPVITGIQVFDETIVITVDNLFDNIAYGIFGGAELDRDTFDYFQDVMESEYYTHDAASGASHVFTIARPDDADVHFFHAATLTK